MYDQSCWAAQSV